VGPLSSFLVKTMENRDKSKNIIISNGWSEKFKTLKKNWSVAADLEQAFVHQSPSLNSSVYKQQDFFQTLLVSPPVQPQVQEVAQKRSEQELAQRNREQELQAQREREKEQELAQRELELVQREREQDRVLQALEEEQLRRMIETSKREYLEYLESTKQKSVPQEEKYYNTCKICFEKELNCALVPCGHMVICLLCVQQIQVCPICRKPVEQVLKVYKG